jgi:hypothetical protein
MFMALLGLWIHKYIDLFLHVVWPSILVRWEVMGAKHEKVIKKKVQKDRVRGKICGIALVLISLTTMGICNVTRKWIW